MTLDLSSNNVQKAMDKLSAQVREIFNKKLNMELNFYLDFKNDTLYLKSQELVNNVPDFLKPMFTSMKVEGYIKQHDEQENVLWGFFDYQYKHPCGSNGYNLAKIWWDGENWSVAFYDKEY